jgi:hypothetical protein
MSGSLALTSVQNGTITLQYTPAATFASGTLYWYRNDNGVLNSQAVVSGSNAITGLPNGVGVTAYVSALDATPAFLGTTAPVLVQLPRTSTSDPIMQLRWRTETTPWQTAQISTEIERFAYPVNVRGYWYQQEIECRAQNKRLNFSMMKLQARIQGRGEEGIS